MSHMKYLHRHNGGDAASRTAEVRWEGPRVEGYSDRAGKQRAKSQKAAGLAICLLLEEGRGGEPPAPAPAPCLP